MWILDSSGDFLGGECDDPLTVRLLIMSREARMAAPRKEVFIRSIPTRRRYGRHQCDRRSDTDSWIVRHAVNHNSISRKHMTIEIAAVKPKDGVRLPLDTLGSVADGR